MKRAVKISLYVLPILVVVGWVAVRLFLDSPWVLGEVTRQLAALYGGAVRIERVHIGWTGTTVSGVQFFEPGEPPSEATAWLKVQSVTADVSLWRLIDGLKAVAPTRVDVQGADVLLRFDDAGHLLTHFPRLPDAEGQALPWERIPPIITIEQSQVRLQKTGHSPLTAKNITGHLDKEGKSLALAGSAESDVGKLLFSGSLEKDSPLVTARIAAATTLHVTEDLLERVPLVPTALLHEFRIGAAEASGGMTVTYDMEKKALHYRGEVAAQHTDIYLPSVAIAVHNGDAKITVEDKLIHVRAANGHALGGAVYAQGDADFRGSVARVNFPELKAEGLNAADVPATWGIPPAVRKSVANGKLFAVATLKMTWSGAEPSPVAATTVVTCAAAGQWLGQAALLAALPHEAIRIECQGTGKVRDPAGKLDPIEFDWQLAPAAMHLPEEKASTRQAPEPFDPFLTTLIAFENNGAANAQPKPETPPNYLDLNFNLKNASLAEIVKNEGLKLPFPLDGKISFRVKASIPVDRLKDLKAYKAEGAAQIDRLVLAGLKLDELTTDFHYGAGVLSFKTLKSAFADNAGKPGAAGTLSGSGSIQVAPLGDVHAELNFDKISLAKLAEQPPEQVQGTISGMLTIMGRADQLQNIKGLQAAGKFASDRLSIFGLALEQPAASVTLKDGVLSFPDLQARVEGTLIKPTASLQLKDDQSFVGKIAMRDWNIAALREIAAAKQISLPPVSGTLNAEAVVAGKLQPFQMAITGDVQTPGLKLDTVETQEVRVRWKLDGKKLQVTDLHASLYDGTATGSATIPLDGKSPGTLQAQVQGLDVNRLAKDLHMPIAVDGHVQGTLKGTLPPFKGKDGSAQFEVDFKAPRLRVQNIPTEQLQGVLQYRSGKIDYNLTGKTLGGTFDLEGQTPAEAKPEKAKDEKIKESRLRIRDVRVGRLLGALGAPTEGVLHGTVNLDVRFTNDAKNLFPHGKGTVRIADVQWGDSVLAENIEGEIVLADRQLRVRNLSGDLADGTLAGQLLYDFKEPERSSFSLNLDAVESGTLVAPWLQQRIEGPIQARFRGKLGRACSGSGEIELAHGKAYGLEIAQWRVPLTWSYSLSQNRGQLDILETSTQLARGRATGKVTLSWDHGARTEGFVRLERVELGDLLRQTIGHVNLGAGRTTAKLEFKGTDVHSLNDLNATLVASFADTQALQVPVLQQIAPFLGVGASTTFQKGNLAARLTRGTAIIEQLTLQGNNLQVYVDGTVTSEERLNLHVVAKNGSVGWPAVQLGPVGVRIPVAGPVPLVLLQEVSALLSNHVAYLDVTGTPRSPVIRPRPLPILSQEAVRFFLNPANSPIYLNP